MTKERRLDLQTYSALLMLLAGVGFCVAGFIVPPLGAVGDSVLWIFAQCLIYAGSVFGIGSYVSSRIADTKAQILREIGAAKK